MGAGRAYRDAGGSVEEFGDSIGDADLVVDALFGIGLARAPDAETAALVAAINVASAPVLALDVPSRVDADPGNVPGAAVHATRTLQRSEERRVGQECVSTCRSRVSPCHYKNKQNKNHNSLR